MEKNSMEFKKMIYELMNGALNLEEYPVPEDEIVKNEFEENGVCGILYKEVLNALDSGTSAKITLNNRRINKEEFEQSLLIPMKQDGMDEYRKEYNEMLLSKVSGTNNSIYQERYLTISIIRRTLMRPGLILPVWVRISSPIWQNCPLWGKNWMRKIACRFSGISSGRIRPRVFPLN